MLSFPRHRYFQVVYWKHFCAQVGREPSTFGLPNAFLCKKLLWHLFVSCRDFPAVSVVTGRDFPAVSIVTDRDFPAVSVVTGRDRKTFLAWGNVNKLCGRRKNVPVSTAGLSILGIGIFWREAKTERLFHSEGKCFNETVVSFCSAQTQTRIGLLEEIPRSGVQIPCHS